MAGWQDWDCEFSLPREILSHPSNYPRPQICPVSTSFPFFAVVDIPSLFLFVQLKSCRTSKSLYAEGEQMVKSQ